jgi:hypothetical protein
MYVAFSERGHDAPENETDLLLSLYKSILPDVILNSLSSELHFCFENNDELDSLFGDLIRECANIARQKRPGVGLPKLTFEIASKQEIASLAIVDYHLAIIAAWLLTGQSELTAKWERRWYMDIEMNLAVLYDFDNHLRSTRSNRAFH